MIRWKLREFMARHKIKNRTLARVANKSEVNFSRLKNKEGFPQLNGKNLESILDSLSTILGYPVKLSEILDGEGFPSVLEENNE